MAKAASVDKIKIAALLLFVAVSVALSTWAIWQAFDESAGESRLSQEYQAAAGEPVLPTPTEWQPVVELTPYPTDRFEMEN